LLIERCTPGTPLGQTLPEPELDQAVTGLLRQLWAQPAGGYPFRPLSQMCAASADEFEREYAAAGAANRIDASLARAGLNCEERLARRPAGLADRMAGLAGLDASRVRQWLFARSVQESAGSPLMHLVTRRLAPP